MNKVEIDTCGGPEPSPAFLWYSVSSPVVVFSLMMQAKAIGSHSFATESVRFLPNSCTFMLLSVVFTDSPFQCVREN